MGGLTLVELMVALTVLAIGLIGMLSMQIDALRGSRHGRHVSEAARVAEEQMELLQRMPWAAIPPSPWSAPRTATGQMNGAGPGQAQPYLVSSLWNSAGFHETLIQVLVQLGGFQHGGYSAQTHGFQLSYRQKIS